ncbi:TPA: hypothetical protein QB323_002053, partial [Pasteurella multocida]|nr:hypothetical protein [Pasteurella multocida]
DEMDVILLAIKGCFPAFNYLRQVGYSDNQWERNLYKINGVRGLYEDVGLDIQGIADDLINDRAIFSEEDCEKKRFSILKIFKVEELNDPRYEMVFDTRIVLTNIKYLENNHTDYGYTARFGSISTPYSELDINGIFNGIIESPFIIPLRNLHTPTPHLLEKELDRFFLFKNGKHPDFLDELDVNLFDSVFFKVKLPMQICYQVHREQNDIFEEENISDIFFFFRDHIDEFIENRKTKSVRLPQITDQNVKIDELQSKIAELEKELQDRKNEEKNTQKIDKRNLFIKYLLAVNYGEDVANNPRSHILENDPTQGVKYANGAIQKSFELKGYKVPVSGRTLNEWTKDIKLTKQAS